MCLIEAPQLIDPSELAELRRRLAHSRRRDLGTGWEHGVPHPWLSGLLERWQAFEPAVYQARIDQLEHRQIILGETQIHVVRANANPDADALPILLTNGWPSSFLEYLELLPLLTDPTAHGSGAEEAFTVVIPSLPGFGFSGPPRHGGMNAREVAGLWNTLMTEHLGHGTYVAHGSDLGISITAWLGRDFPQAVRGIHLASPHLAIPKPARDPAEAELVQAATAWRSAEGAYAHMHATKPATLAAALGDSPAGLAAWIGEKMHAWSSGDLVGDSDFVLANLTLYWARQSIGTSFLPYWAGAHRDDPLPLDDPSPVPAAISLFHGEIEPFAHVTEALTRRYVSVASWREHPRGGHFPAVSAPELLVNDLRDAFRSLR